MTSTGRRPFLAMASAALVVAFADPLSRPRPARTETRPYVIDVHLLYGTLSFQLRGALIEVIDPAAGRYHVTAAGHGDDITNQLESSGALMSGRWTPYETHSFVSVRGRESRSTVRYAWRQRTVEYDFRGETFFMRRLRLAHDVLSIPESMHVDDALTAMLNYGDGRWPPDPDGSFRTYVVRRKRPENEGVEDASRDARAELAPFGFAVVIDAASGKRTAQFDLSRFSSWAKRDRPARITFRHDGHPEEITMEMALGTSVHVSLGNATPTVSGCCRGGAASG